MNSICDSRFFIGMTSYRASAMRERCVDIVVVFLVNLRGWVWRAQANSSGSSALRR
jgi:hypothetical protein